MVFEPEEILVNESGLAILTLQSQNSNVRRFNVSVECGMTPFISKGELFILISQLKQNIHPQVI